jgi:hypothetical protein
MSHPNFFFTPLYKDHEKPSRVDYWAGLVSATRDEIHRALFYLEREPVDAAELQNEIIKHRRDALSKVLEEAEKQSNYCPY